MGKPDPKPRPVTGRSGLRIALVLVLIGAIGWAAYAVGRQVWAEYQLHEAERDLSARRFGPALDRLRSCLKVRTESTEVTLLAARTARRGRDYPEAARLVKRYADLGGLPEAGRLEQTLAVVQRGDISPHVERSLLAAAEGAGPDAPLILEALAQGELQALRWGPALRCIDLLRKQEPGWPEPWLWEGWVRENLSDVPGAVAAYRKALDLNPGDDETRARLAAAFVRANELAEAAPLFEAVLPSHPDDPVVVLGLAHCRRAAGRADEAARLIDDLLARRPDLPPAWAEHGKVDLARDRPADAEPWLRKALDREPDEPDTIFHFVQCLNRLGREKEAAGWGEKYQRLEANRQRLETLFAKLLHNSDDVEVRVEAGTLLIEMGREREGVAMLSAAAEDPRGLKAGEALKKHFETKNKEKRVDKASGGGS